MGAPLMAVPRLVLDSNIVLSALLFSNGHLAWLGRAWQTGRFIPLISRATAEELIRVLAYPKFKLTAAECDDLLADYLPYCETVMVADKVIGLPDCRDPGDLPFLKLALAAKADALVSGDDDLRVLAKTFPIRIIPASEIVRTFPALIAGE
jgi:uncharacterized protein